MIIDDKFIITFGGIEVELDESECNIEFYCGIKSHNKYRLEIEVEAGSEADKKLRRIIDNDE